MNVLIMAGEQVGAIYDAVATKLVASGIDLKTAKYYEDAKNMWMRGEHFDKIVVIDKAIHMDGELKDAGVIKRKLNEFIGGLNGQVLCVFVAFNKEMASWIYDEATDILDRTAIVVYEQQLNVVFVSNIIMKELSSIPARFLYKPPELKASVTKFEIEEDNKAEVTYELKSDESDDIYGDGDEYEVDTDEDVSADYERRDVAFNTDVDVDYDSIEVDEDEEDEDSIYTETKQVNNREIGDIGTPKGIKKKGQSVESETVTRSRVEYNPEEEDEIYSLDVSKGVKKNKAENIRGNKAGDDVIPNMYSTDIDEADDEDEIYTGVRNTGRVGRREEIEDTRADVRYDKDDSGVNSVAPRKNRSAKMSANMDKAFMAFATRGMSISVFGVGGSGTSTVAYNLANCVANMGYNALLVDLDPINKTQAYISADSYDAIQPSFAGLMEALNSSTGVTSYVAIPKEGLHVLTMGLASDAKELMDVIHTGDKTANDKFLRFYSAARSLYHFVIYDMKFSDAVGCAQVIPQLSDGVVLNVEASNWGLTKFMMQMYDGGISQDMTDVLFERGQILFNKCKNLKTVGGLKVNSGKPITLLKALDKVAQETIGEDPGVHLEDIAICGDIPFDEEIEGYWYTKKNSSDTKNGMNMYAELLHSILMSRI